MTQPIRNLGAIIQDSLRLKFLENAFNRIGPKKCLLDLGSGVKPFENLYTRYSSCSIGIDVSFSPHDLSKIDVFATGTALPFRGSSFDIVLCSEVMEHIAEPKLLLQEIYRVLNPGGRLILTTPFLVPLHEEPHDFYRYTKYGLRYLLEDAGLHVVSIMPFSETLGVLISFLVQIELKFWHAISKTTRHSMITSAWNPLIFLFVYLPQIMYLYFLSIGNSIPFVRKLIKKLEYTTKGYGIVAQK